LQDSAIIGPAAWVGSKKNSPVNHRIDLMPTKSFGHFFVVISSQIGLRFGTVFAHLRIVELRRPTAMFRPKERIMRQEHLSRIGKIRYGLAALLLGLPLPIVIIAFLWGGCRS